MLKPLRVLSPGTVGEAVRELDGFADRARLYAGGSELLLLLRHGLVDTDYLIDIKGIGELGEIAWDGRMLHIGWREIFAAVAPIRRLQLLSCKWLMVTVRLKHPREGGNFAMGVGS